MSNSLNIHALALKDATTLTIASGVITVTQEYHVIAAETGTSDTVDTINRGFTNLAVKGNTYRPLLLVYADAGDTIILSHGTGNLTLPDDTDITITDTIGQWLLWRGSAYYAIGAASGGAGTTIPDAVGVIVVAKNGNDANDGLTIAAPKLTISGAITAAASAGDNGTGAVPSASNRILVQVLDAGHYEDEPSDIVTCQAFINIDARNAKLLGRLELVDNVVCHFSWIEALSAASALAGTCIRKNSGTALAYVFVELLQCKGAGLGVFNSSSGQLFIRFGKLEVLGAGFGVGDDGSAPSGHVHIYGGDIYLEANNATGIATSGANKIVGSVEHILEVPAGTLTGTRGIALLTGATGEINVNVQDLVADTTYEVIAGTLNLIVTSMTGTAGTVTGTANILRGNHVSSDDHTQYALLAGRAGGQTLIGGTGAGDDLHFQTTSHGTRGTYLFDEFDDYTNGTPFVQNIGATGAMFVRNDNVGAAGAPTVNDDVNDGFFPGSIWTTTGGDIYLCAKNNGGAAVWEQVTSSSLPADPLPLENGGTEADLSATGPGSLVQASSGAVVTLRADSDGDDHLADEGANYTTTSTSFVEVDSTDFALTITTTGGPVLIGFNGSCVTSAAGQRTYFNVHLDDTTYLAANDGINAMGWIATDFLTVRAISFTVRWELAAGTYKFELHWKTSAGTATLYAGAGTAGLDIHPQFWVQEIR